MSEDNVRPREHAETHENSQRWFRSPKLIVISCLVLGCCVVLAATGAVTSMRNRNKSQTTFAAEDPIELISGSPSELPSILPSYAQSLKPSHVSSNLNSIYPSTLPSHSPSYLPNFSPSQTPSIQPSDLASIEPGRPRSFLPTQTSPSIELKASQRVETSNAPIGAPIFFPTRVSIEPSNLSSKEQNYPPSRLPSFLPSQFPSIDYSDSPLTEPSGLQMPSSLPSPLPSIPGPNGIQQLFAGKKGSCWTLRDESKPGSYVDNLPKLKVLNPYWMYSWGPKPAEGVPTEASPDGGIQIVTSDDDDANNTQTIDFVPMLWGYYNALFESFVYQILWQNPCVILGFNEPDQNSQSNLSVARAVEGWSRLVDKVNSNVADPSKVLMVSPSCVSAMSIWMQSFMDEVTEQNIRVDAIGVHFYGSTSAEIFRRKMQEIYEYYGLPIVVTEFAVADWEATSVETNRFSPERVLAFMKQVLPWMEEQDWILGYSWYSFEITDRFGTSSALVYEELSDTGETEVRLTPLGDFYASFTASEVGPLAATEMSTTDIAI